MARRLVSILSRRGPLALLVAAVLIAAPVALAGPIIGGARNPSPNASTQFTAETEIIASNSTYGTRQSNKGTGGGAIYGCRARPGGPPCINATNLNTGTAFGFTTAGNVGGTIMLRNTSGAPLTTNATGVAKGFNANFLEGKQAADFLGATQQATDSAKLGGQPASSYLTTAQLQSAVVAANGTLTSGRGASSAAQTSTTSYTVTFGQNVSKCAYTASPVGAALTSGQIGVAPAPSNTAMVDVNAPSALPNGFDLQLTC